MTTPDAVLLEPLTSPVISKDPLPSELAERLSDELSRIVRGLIGAEVGPVDEGDAMSVSIVIVETLLEVETKSGGTFTQAVESCKSGSASRLVDGFLFISRGFQNRAKE